MNILILGGTLFLGRYLAEEGIRRNHKLTLFNRGKSNPRLFPDLETIKGDRDGDIAGLKGRKWDLAIDVSGYTPGAVRRTAELLKDNIGRYLFVSTMIVYDDLNKIGLHENDKLATMGDNPDETVTSDSYGPLKGDCERIVKKLYPRNYLNIRPGVIIGPNDNTDRFTYWVERISRGGRVLAPGRPDDPVQVIDVRDLAPWMFDLIEKETTGEYNAVGPEYELTMGALFEECRKVSGAETEFIWIESEFLLERDIQPWKEIPLWRRGGHDFDGFMRIDGSRALTEGLKLRPLKQSISDVLEFARTLDESYQWQAGLDPNKEAELIVEWEESLQTA